MKQYIFLDSEEEAIAFVERAQGLLKDILSSPCERLSVSDMEEQTANTVLRALLSIDWLEEEEKDLFVLRPETYEWVEHNEVPGQLWRHISIGGDKDVPLPTEFEQEHEHTLGFDLKERFQSYQDPAVRKPFMKKLQSIFWVIVVFGMLTAYFEVQGRKDSQLEKIPVEVQEDINEIIDSIGRLERDTLER